MLDTVQFRIAVLEGELDMYRKDAALPRKQRLWKDGGLVETTRARISEMDNVLFKMKKLTAEDRIQDAGQ